MQTIGIPNSKPKHSCPFFSFMDPLLSYVKLLAIDLQTLTPTGHHSSIRPPTLTRATRPIARAETLGVVVTRDHRSGKFIKFHVDDGSGCVPCILWLNHAPANAGGDDVAANAAEEQAAAARLGAVVRVRGRVGVYKGEVQITVRDLWVERDANMEVLWWLECVRLARVCYDVKDVC